MRGPLQSLTWLALLLVAGYGCAGSPTTTPSTPVATPAATPESLGGAGATDDSGIVGVFQLDLDPGAGTASLAPVNRSGQAFGDTFMVDNSGFLAGFPCRDCFHPDNVGFTSQGQLYVDFGFRHPYGLPDPNNPKGGDRLDLHLFDFRGLFLWHQPGDGGGTTSFPQLAAIGAQSGRGPSTLSIDNSGFLAGISIDGMTGTFDGYTDGFFPTTSTLHPFALMLEDTRPGNFLATHQNGWTNLRQPEGHNVFPMGGGPYSKRIFFDLEPGDPVVHALVVLIASYGVAGVGRGPILGQRMNPVYYLPEFNQKEPWRVQIDPTNNALEEGKTNSTATYKVTIYDWQHSVGPYTTSQLTPSPSIPRDKLARPSRVIGLRAQVPGVADPANITTQLEGGNGDPASPLIWNLTVPNALNGTEGAYVGLAEIVDEYVPPAGQEVGVAADGHTIFRVGRASTFIPFTAKVNPPGDPDFLNAPGSIFEGHEGQKPSWVEYGSTRFDNFGAYTIGGSVHVIQGVLEASGRNDMVGHDILQVQSTTWGNSWGVPTILNSGVSAQLRDQSHPTLAVGPNGEFYVAYQSAQSNGKHEIELIASSNFGTSWSAPRRVSLSDGRDNNDPRLTVTPSGRVVVSWEYVNGSRKIGAAFSDNAGLSWTRWTYSADRSVQRTQVLAFPTSVTATGFAIIYEQSADVLLPDVYLLPHLSGTVSNSGRIAISTDALLNTASDARGAIAPSDGRILVAYEHHDAVLNQIRLEFRQKTATGSSFGPVSVLAKAINGQRLEHPDLLARPDGTTLVVWSDNSNAALGYDVYLLRSPNLGATWEEQSTLVSGLSNQRWPELTRDGASGHILATWWDDAWGSDPTALRLAVEDLG
ncbi:MAG: hypothetical protein ABI743_04465 [bacterium]